MQFTRIGGDESKLWRWFTLPGTDYAVELFCPAFQELSAVTSRHRFGTVQVDLAGLTKHIATAWFRDFRNGFDQHGKPIQNTPEMRAAMLEAADVFGFVIGKLHDAAAWREEGNGGSGSAS